MDLAHAWCTYTMETSYVVRHYKEAQASHKLQEIWIEGGGDVSQPKMGHSRFKLFASSNFTGSSAVL